MPKPRTLLALGALLLLAFAPPVRAELSKDEFDQVEDDAKRQMKLPDRKEIDVVRSHAWDQDVQNQLAEQADKARRTKIAVVRKLAEDDRQRSVELLVDWALTLVKRLDRELGPHFQEADEDLTKFEALLRKNVEANGGTWPPSTVNQDVKNAWDAKRYTQRRARLWIDAEKDVLYQIARAVGEARDGDAIRWLLTKGLKKLRRADGAEQVALAAVDAFTNADPELVRKAVLDEAENEKEPAARVLVLDWLGRHKPPEAFELTLDALEAEEPVVQRAAVRTLVALDDRRAVKPLIDALLDARSVLAVEIEDALHHFTGQSFQSSHAVWLDWWEREGKAWAQGEDDQERFRPEPTPRARAGATFYGLQTASERIVFVLDRSGSMQSPATDDSRQAHGPVTPGGGGKPAEPKIEGDTKIEVAKNQLIYSIRTLPPDVHFNVVFYSNEVTVWKDPPAMLPADEKNKAEAIAWVEKIEAEGSTQLFDALLKAIEYADNLDEKNAEEGGADTIFLLSDGSPTDMQGQVLPPEEIEAGWAKVQHANRIFRCVIHTIGVGRGHNRSLMERIARETGGTYKAVGTN